MPTITAFSGLTGVTLTGETQFDNDGNNMCAFYGIAASSQTGQTLTITTGTDETTWRSIVVGVYSGIKTTAPRLAFNQQQQTTPGTGTNAVSSGLLGTLSTQPAALIAISSNEGGTYTAPNIGSGLSYNERYRNNGFALEDRRLTATTSVAGVFNVYTGEGSSLHVTMAWAFEEAGGSSSSIAPLAANYYQMGNS